MSYYGTLLFEIELLLSQMLFFFPCPKQKKYPLRLVIVFFVLLTTAFFFPMPFDICYTAWYSLIRFTSLFLLSSVGMYFLYDLPAFNIISLSSMGYAMQHVSYHLFLIVEYLMRDIFSITINRYVGELFILVLVGSVLYFSFVRRFSHDMLYRTGNSRLAAISIVIFSVCIVLSSFSRLEIQNTYSLSIYSVVGSTFAIFLQFMAYQRIRLMEENMVISKVIAMDQRKYEITKSTIELLEGLNMRCHDLKQRLSVTNSDISQGEKQSMESLIELYDLLPRTGNAFLDTVLTENIIYYKSQGVNITFMGNGKLIDFMEEMDIAALFGNAIANATEAVVKLEETKRDISIILESKGGFITATIRNWYEGELELSEGLPLSSKNTEIGQHGYGMKSMRVIAQKYNGDINISTDKGIFILSIYMVR